MPVKVKIGRPKLPKSRVRTRVLTVRLTAEQMKLITAAAKASHQKRSEWIRDAVSLAAIGQSKIATPSEPTPLAAIYQTEVFQAAWKKFRQENYPGTTS